MDDVWKNDIAENDDLQTPLKLLPIQPFCTLTLEEACVLPQSLADMIGIERDRLGGSFISEVFQRLSMQTENHG